MSTSTRTLEKTCKACGTHLIEVHMKNPFIDDFMDECPKCDPGFALSFLNSSAHSAAKSEQDDQGEI
jgi:deoxyadenosine/deoxycytidine kinase